MTTSVLPHATIASLAQQADQAMAALPTNIKAALAARTLTEQLITCASFELFQRYSPSTISEPAFHSIRSQIAYMVSTQAQSEGNNVFQNSAITKLGSDEEKVSVTAAYAAAKTLTLFSEGKIEVNVVPTLQLNNITATMEEIDAVMTFFQAGARVAGANSHQSLPQSLKL